MPPGASRSITAAFAWFASAVEDTSVSKASVRETGGVRYRERMLSEIPDRISIDPAVCFGRPVVRGTRIWVGLILSMMASGVTSEEILREYPQLSDDDLRASLAYGAGLVDAHFVDVA